MPEDANRILPWPAPEQMAALNAALDKIGPSREQLRAIRAALARIGQSSEQTRAIGAALRREQAAAVAPRRIKPRRPQPESPQQALVRQFLTDKPMPNASAARIERAMQPWLAAKEKQTGCKLMAPRKSTILRVLRDAP